MREKFLTALFFCFCVVTSGIAQETPPSSSAEIQELRQQVQALTGMVKTLQQQVNDQQTSNASQNTGAALPQNPEPAALAGASLPPVAAAPKASAPPLFPTSDNAVVASNAAPSSAAPASAVNANGSAFPTSDASVTAGADTSLASSSGSGSALTQPIPILGGGGSKTYMNISFDGLFALAESSARDLYNVEVGDHDPQQRGFNARNAEIALDGAVDPFFEGFANIVLKLNNDNETEIELEEAFMQTDESAVRFASERRAVFRRVRPHQSDASAHLGFRRRAARTRAVARLGWIARRRRAALLDAAGLVVFAADRWDAKWPRQHRLLLSQSR